MDNAVDEALNGFGKKISITLNEDGSCTLYDGYSFEGGFWTVENGAVVTEEILIDCGMIHSSKDGLKVLGNGELTKKLTVKASKFTASAKEKIEAVGGTCEVI